MAEYLDYIETPIGTLYKGDLIKMISSPSRVDSVYPIDGYYKVYNIVIEDGIVGIGFDSRSNTNTGAIWTYNGDILSEITEIKNRKIDFNEVV